MQSGAGAGEQLGATIDIHAVVGIASIGGAAPHGNQPVRPQLAEVVGNQILRLADEAHQLADPPVAARELGQQPPSNGMPHEHQRAWRMKAPARGRRTHADKIRQSRSIGQLKLIYIALWIAASNLRRCSDRTKAARSIDGVCCIIEDDTAVGRRSLYADATGDLVARARVAGFDLVPFVRRGAFAPLGLGSFS